MKSDHLLVILSLFRIISAWVTPSHLIKKGVWSCGGFTPEETVTDLAAPYAIIVDPMDVNGRHVLNSLEEWGIEALAVLSPAVVAELESRGELSLSHLAAPAKGEETTWAEDRGLRGRFPLAIISGFHI